MDRNKGTKGAMGWYGTNNPDENSLKAKELAELRNKLHRLCLEYGREIDVSRGGDNNTVVDDSFDGVDALITKIQNRLSESSENKLNK